METIEWADGTVCTLPDGWCESPPSEHAGVGAIDRVVREVRGVVVEDRRLEGPAGKALAFDVPTLRGSEGAALLVEESGLLRWVLPSRTHSDADVEHIDLKTRAPEKPPTADGQGPLTRLRVCLVRFSVELFTEHATRMAIDAHESEGHHGFVEVRGADPAGWLPVHDLATRPYPRRVLLLLHGIFANTRASFDGLCEHPTELEALFGEYDLVIGWDHPTLSRLPSENAADLERALRALWSLPPRIDVLAFSRGGLVARSLVEQVLDEEWGGRVERVLFIGTPHAGTPLASPGRWHHLVDLLTNLALGSTRSSTWGAGLVRGLSVLLKALASTTLDETAIPGLAAMDPVGPYLRGFDGKRPDSVKYAGLAASYEPHADLDPPIKRLLDDLADKCLTTRNDLVVPTESVQAGLVPGEPFKVQDGALHHLTIMEHPATIAWIRGQLPMQRLLAFGSFTSNIVSIHALAASSPRPSREQALQETLRLLRTGGEELDDLTWERLEELEDRFEGLLDQAEERLAEDTEPDEDTYDEPGVRKRITPRDGFSPKAHLKELRRTLKQRWNHVDPPLEPKSTRELVELLRSGRPLRPVGSARALSRASEPGHAAALGTSHLSEVLKMGPPVAAGVDPRSLYRCGAGRTVSGVLDDLNRETPPRRLANLGAGSFQTIGGAISTGTHGSGLSLPGLHQSVASLAVATFEDGEPVVLWIERESRPVSDPDVFDEWAAAFADLERLDVPVRLVQDDEAFAAHVMGLGCLGVIFAVTLFVQPQCWLRESRVPAPWSSVKTRLLQTARNTRHHELLIDPWPDERGEHACLETRRVLSPRQRREGGRPHLMAVARTGIGRSVGSARIEAAIRKPLRAAPRNLRTAIERTAVQHYVDISDRVLRLDLELGSLTGEYAVDFRQVVPAVDALLELYRANIVAARAWLASNSRDIEGLWRRHPVPTGPIAVRFVAGDDALLSAQYGRDTAMIEVHFPSAVALDARLDDDGKEGARMRRYRAYDEGRRAFLREAEELLCSRFEARPHWGLYHHVDGERARELFPGFATWHDYLERHNPHGVFDGPAVRTLRRRNMS